MGKHGVELELCNKLIFSYTSVLLISGKSIVLQGRMCLVLSYFVLFPAATYDLMNNRGEYRYIDMLDCDTNY
jgi:hypothetical protein